MVFNTRPPPKRTDRQPTVPTASLSVAAPGNGTRLVHAHGRADIIAHIIATAAALDQGRSFLVSATMAPIIMGCAPQVHILTTKGRAIPVPAQLCTEESDGASIMFLGHPDKHPWDIHVRQGMKMDHISDELLGALCLGMTKLTGSSKSMLLSGQCTARLATGHSVGVDITLPSTWDNSEINNKEWLAMMRGLKKASCTPESTDSWVVTTGDTGAQCQVFDQQALRARQSAWGQLVCWEADMPLLAQAARAHSAASDVWTDIIRRANIWGEDVLVQAMALTSPEDPNAPPDLSAIANVLPKIAPDNIQALKWEMERKRSEEERARLIKAAQMGVMKF